MIARGKRTLLGGSIGEVRDCYVLAGQSNINGFNNVLANIPANIQGSYPDAKIYQTNNSFVPISSSVNSSLQIPTTNGSWAVQYPLIRSIVQSRGNSFFIQYAVGATSLATDWLPSAGARYIQLKNAIGNFKNGTPSTVNFKAVIWVQGEQDATVLADANAYESNLTAFIAAIRATTGAATPFVIVRLNTNANLTYKNNIRTAQTNVCSAVSSCYLVDVDSCEMQADEIHYTAQGYIDMSAAIMACLTTNNLL